MSAAAYGALGPSALHGRAAGCGQIRRATGSLRAVVGDEGATFAPADGIDACAGPAFDPGDIAGYLASWDIKRKVELTT